MTDDGVKEAGRSRPSCFVVFEAPWCGYELYKGPKPLVDVISGIHVHPPLRWFQTTLHDAVWLHEGAPHGNIVIDTPGVVVGKRGGGVRGGGVRVG